MNNKASTYLSSLNRSNNTIHAYGTGLRRFFEVVGQPDDLTEENYIKFLRSLRRLSPSTQQLYTTAVMGMYHFHRACNDVNLPELAKHYLRRKPKTLLNFDAEAIEKVIQHCSNLRGDIISLRDRALVITLADTGMRISEACALKRGDVDWKRQKAIITGKGEKQAVIRFSNRSIQALKDYLQERAKIESTTPLTSQPLFARHDVSALKKIKRLSAGGAWLAIKGDKSGKLPGRIREAGVDRSVVRIHDFRHYFVTRLYTATNDIKAAQVGARHESIATTGRYTHLLNEFDEVYDSVFNQKGKL